MSLEATIDGVVIELVEGDIIEQADVEAVVNAANAELLPGGGVAGAIHRAAGPGLSDDCRPFAPINPGTCVVTGAHELPNRWVIHCLGPVYGLDEPAADLLASCYREALQLADARGIASVAFPAISTGAFGYPMEEAADVALRAVAEMAPGLQRTKRVRFVLLAPHAIDAHRAALERLREGLP